VFYENFPVADLKDLAKGNLWVKAAITMNHVVLRVCTDSGNFKLRVSDLK
jgi:hypothetical protein